VSTTVSISVRLPGETAQALDRIAVATDRPRTYLIVKALEVYLDEYADYLVALDRLKDKDDPVISSRALRERIGRKDRVQAVRRKGPSRPPAARGDSHPGED
jgi:RHH-type transcriptional regulator, rel operon repressor / antitoxin RelB